ncbi:GH92 family glycosyl hydrolase [Nocardioides hungaricus]
MRLPAIALLCVGILGLTPPAGAETADPLTGTGGSRPWFSGNTTPAATVPFGMVQLGPDTTGDAASGYDAASAEVRGFSPTHLSGAGCRAFGDAPVLPVAGAVPENPGTATAVLEKETERAVPGSYTATVGGVGVDLTAAARVGLMRFAYPAGERAFVLVKAAGGLADTSAARVSFPSDREVAVRVRGGGFCGQSNEYVVSVLYRFDHPFRSRGTWDGGAWVDFGRERVVRAQVAVSYVDARGARRNLELTDPGWSVDRLARDAARAWDTELDRVTVSGGDPAERALLRTALYHALLHPTPVSDADGRYPGFDGRVRRLPRGEVQLSSISGWDVYRTQIPLLAWLRPDVASQVVRSLLRDARQSGAFPRWPVVAQDSGVMDGDPAGPIAAAAWSFGARDFPLDEVVDRLVRQPREGGADYRRLGWVPGNGSATLEYAAADFAISRLARAAGRTALAERVERRSAGWRTLLDGDLLRSRDAAGAVVAGGFEEGSALQYTLGGVPQDMAGLLGSLGTAEEVTARLDDFFTELNAGTAPYAWLGNQPSFLTPWTYQWLGEPARTQDVVDRARAELWSAGPDGLPGNDDLGSLSSWYVWTSLGLYPLTPGTPNLAVGTPVFDTITVRPRGGPATRIVRSGPRRYVAALRVDGADRARSWLAGRPRRIEVVTTADADPAWGTAPQHRPPSYGS